jgi:hypothetical protein
MHAVPGPSSFKVQITTEKLKRYKSAGTDQILTNWLKEEMIHYVLRSTSSLIPLEIRKKCHSSARNV